MTGSQDMLKIISGDNVKPESDDKKGDGKCLRAVMSIPKLAVGLVIGKGGMTLHEIRKETGARIDLDRRGRPNHDGFVNATFYGTEEQLSQASIKVDELVESSIHMGVGGLMRELARNASYIALQVKLSGHDLEKVPGVIKHRVVVPSEVVGMIIGTRGETIKKMSIESGARIALDTTPRPNATTKIFDITGTPEAIESAKREIRKILPVCHLPYKDAVRQVVPTNAVPRSAMPSSAISSSRPNVIARSVVPTSAVPSSVVPSSHSNVTGKSNTGSGVRKMEAQTIKDDIYKRDWIIRVSDKPQHLQGIVNPNHLMKRADESGLTLQEAIREKDEDEHELGKQHMIEWIEYYRDLGIPERVDEVKKQFRLIYGEEPEP